MRIVIPPEQEAKIEDIRAAMGKRSPTAAIVEMIDTKHDEIAALRRRAKEKKGAQKP